MYRNALPNGTLLVNGFLTRVVATKDGTAAISKDGTFYYNPEWFKENVTTPARLRDICMHEVLHPVLGDLAREPNKYWNTAGDCVINSMLFNLKLSDCELQEHTYSKTEIPECLLRPHSNPPQEFIGLYGSLYPTLVATGSQMRCENPMDIQTALQVLLGPDFEEPELLGSHNSSKPTKTINDANVDPLDLSLPSDVMGDLSQKIHEIAEERTSGADAENTMDVIFSVLRVKKSVKTELLKSFETASKMNMLKQFFTVSTEQRSMVPTAVSRREAQMMAMGITPVFFSVRSPARDALAGMGIDMYIDVSGSVYDALPLMIGVFKAMRGDIKTVNVFSNAVVELPVDDFINGKVKTTGGTDFNCVIEHAIKNQRKKVMVFTDGDAAVTEENRKLAIEHIPMLGVVYFGSYRNRGNWLEKQYKKIFKLEDLVDIKTEHVNVTDVP